MKKIALILGLLLSLVCANAQALTIHNSSATVQYQLLISGTNYTWNTSSDQTFPDSMAPQVFAAAAAYSDLSMKSWSSASDNITAYTCTAGSGGAATEALTCTGLLSTDTVLAVTQKTPGANGLALVGWSTLTTSHITGIWHADPGANSVVEVLIKR